MATFTNLEPLSLTVKDFCNAHGIGRTTVYKMWKLGKGPKFFQVGRTRRIPMDEAKNWRCGEESV